VAIGNYSLDANTTGDNNTAIGYNSLSANTTGGNNTASGSWALYSNTTGANNTALGYGALAANTEGAYNVASGLSALAANTTGEFNVAIGQYSLDANTEGDHNTALGYDAGDVITTGSQNVIIGSVSDPSANSATNQIVIGYGVTGTGNNEIALGNTSISAIKAQVTSITGYSDSRIKRDIRDTDLGLALINELRPVKYRLKNPADYPASLLEQRYKTGEESRPKDDETVYDGLVAQEVKASLDNMGLEWSGWSKNDSDGKQGIQYGALVVPLIKAVQELSAKVDKLESQLEANSAEVSASQ